MGALLRARNVTRGTLLCQCLSPAGGLWGQTRGLLSHDHLDPAEGMLFERSRFVPFMSMHMFFMRFPIDIVFLDGQGRVLKVNRDLRPWRFSSVVFGARFALELAAGAASRSHTEVGDLIAIEPNA
jgi:uncharacterized membrane protein (UPF0127 family)